MSWADKSILACARAAHEALCSFDIAVQGHADAYWVDILAWQKTSMIHGVWAVLAGDNTPEKSHLSWVKERMRLGWRFGIEKSEKEKTNPYLVPYDSLPKVEQARRTLFVLTVRAMAVALELELKESGTEVGCEAGADGGE